MMLVFVTFLVFFLTVGAPGDQVQAAAASSQAKNYRGWGKKQQLQGDF